MWRKLLTPVPPTRWVDSDGSGSISVVEFTRAVSHGPKCHLRDKPGAVMKLFAALDEDGSGELEEDEVRHGLLAVPCRLHVPVVIVAKPAVSRWLHVRRGRAARVPRGQVSGLDATVHMPRLRTWPVPGRRWARDMRRLPRRHLGNTSTLTSSACSSRTSARSTSSRARVTNGGPCLKTTRTCTRQ